MAATGGLQDTAPNPSLARGALRPRHCLLLQAVSVLSQSLNLIPPVDLLCALYIIAAQHVGWMSTMCFRIVTSAGS